MQDIGILRIGRPAIQSRAMTHSDLCAALVIIGAEPCDAVSKAETNRLAELGLIHFEAGEWSLTAAGSKLLPRLIDGDEVLEL
jgi:hypothetical protein